MRPGRLCSGGDRRGRHRDALRGAGDGPRRAGSAAPPRGRGPGRGARWTGGGGPRDGRKRTVALDPTLRRDLEALIEPTARGDPETPLRWTTKSVRNLAA